MFMHIKNATLQRIAFFHYVSVKINIAIYPTVHPSKIIITLNKMFKYAAVLFATLACALAKPGLLSAPLAYTAPAAAVLAAPSPVVTATSSQVVARNFNGIATAPIIAPVAPVAPLAAPFAAAYTAPVAAPIYTTNTPFAKYAAAYPAPLVARHAALPYAYRTVPAYTAPAAARLVASPTAARLTYAPYFASPYVL
uniref:Uncharacterized protein n=1 Tax=Glossina austeni TaxID=7395 RepID=A0A1A9V5X4_GLOAU